MNNLIEDAPKWADEIPDELYTWWGGFVWSTIFLSAIGSWIIIALLIAAAISEWAY